MSRISAVLALACLSLGVVAQIPSTASAIDLELVTAQYDNSGLASKSCVSVQSRLLLGSCGGDG